MALLFGSRSRNTNRKNSDIDILVTKKELSMIPKRLLITNGGPIDAFFMPNSDGWALAIDDSERMMLVFDSSGDLLGCKEVNIKDIIKLAKKLQGGIK